ncbi:MAG: OmpH family outer membrane protein [Gammaproteobacteria bacterium]|nr:OmpH family outer membrane protein [Gammaproteobacteria bacterium]
MIRKLAFAVIVYFGANLLPVFAQQVDANLKVGFVNIRKLMVQAPQLQQIQQKLEAEFEADNQSIIAIRKSISHLSLKYDKLRDKTSLLDLQKSIGEKQRQLAKQQKRLQDDYNVRRNEELGKLQTLIVKMVGKVSQEKKMDIVLNNTGVIYVSNRIDITPDVFKYLSEQKID